MSKLPKDAFANLPAFPSYTMKESAVIPPIQEQLHMGDGSSPDLSPSGVEVWFYFQHYRTGEMIIDGEPATIVNPKDAVVSFDLKPKHLNYEGPHAGAFVVIYQDGSVEYPSETYIRVDVTPALASGDALNPDPEDPIQERGPPGPVGPEGPQGPPGDTILSGTSNPTKRDGQTGDFYINTKTHTIFGPKTSSGWGSGVSLVGPPGPQGPPGDTVLSGGSDPTPTTGQVGDFYINTATWTIFGPKTSSGWGSGTSLIGPEGPQGPEGPRGPSVAIADNGTTAIDTATLLNFTDNIEVQPKGDGSGEAEIRATGSGGGSGGSVSVEDDGTPIVGTADTLNFGSNISATNPSAGNAEIDAKDTHSVFENEDGTVSVEADTVVLGDNLTVTDNGSGKVRIDGSGSSGGGPGVPEGVIPGEVTKSVGGTVPSSSSMGAGGGQLLPGETLTIERYQLIGDNYNIPDNITLWSYSPESSVNQIKISPPPGPSNSGPFGSVTNTTGNPIGIEVYLYNTGSKDEYCRGFVGYTMK